jgi:hypothetical protein
MLDKQLWNEMTESQRQFVLLGIRTEQERIIQLLDKNLGNVDWDDLIKLIKGEKK